MYMDGIKLITKNEKELEILRKAVNIYSENTEMEFGFKKGPLLLKKSGKWQMTERR